ncbi:hypothetical protein Tco_0869587, partial [Tanacetum coccineum]
MEITVVTLVEEQISSWKVEGNEFRLTRAWRMDESGSNRANGTRLLSRAYDFTPWLLNLAYTSFLASLRSVMTSFEKDLSVLEFRSSRGLGLYKVQEIRHQGLLREVE